MFKKKTGKGAERYGTPKESNINKKTNPEKAAQMFSCFIKMSEYITSISNLLNLDKEQ